MTDDPNDLEAQRQEQAEREFTAAREALAAQDQQQRSQWASEEARQAAIEASKAQQMTEAMTREAVERDPWNAVRLDIPQDADADFLANVQDMADTNTHELKVAVEHATQAGHHRSAQTLADFGEASAKRVSNAERLGELLVQYDANKVSDLNEHLGDDLVQRLTAAPTRDQIPAGRLSAYVDEARAEIAEMYAGSGVQVSPEQADKAAEQESAPQVTRMYRGIGKNVWEAEEGDALFFSTDPERAATFGELHYVDVTADELAKFEQPHSRRILDAEPAARNDYRTADPDIIARLQPVPQPELSQADKLAGWIAETKAELQAATDAEQGTRSDILASRLEGLETEAALGAEIADFLNEQIHELPAREIDAIAYTAAANNLSDRRNYDMPEITKEALFAAEDDKRDIDELLLNGRIPDDADHYLLHRIHTAAGERIDGKTNRDADPWERGEFEELAGLKAREIEADGRLEQSRTLIHDEGAEPEAFAAEAELGAAWPHHAEVVEPTLDNVFALIASGGNWAEARRGEPMTSEDIEANPMNAINMPLPANPSPELLADVHATANDLSWVFREAMAAARSGEPFAAWQDGGPDAHEYFEQPWLNALDRLETVEAMRPEFKAERVASEKHRHEQQVAAGILDRDERISEIAAEAWERVAPEKHGPDRGPDDSPKGGQKVKPAPEQAAEQPPEALTREAIERDPMNAVTMPLPDNADCELLGVVADTAAQIAEDKREQAYTALYEGGPEAGKPFEADADRADRRFDEAAERFEVMACDHAAGEGPTHEADLLTPAEAFRSNAGTATMTDQQRKEQDIVARIIALESLLGAGDNAARRDYEAGQDGFAARIENAAGPEHVAFLAAGKLAHSQDYAAELCEQVGVKLGLEDRFEEAAGFMAESRAHREIAGIERGAVPEPQQDREQIGQDMADAAKEALGGTPRPEFIIVGPSQEQQAGQQQADPAEQIGQAHMPNYAELRAFTEGQQAAADMDRMEAHAPNYAALKAATDAMQAVQQEAAPTGPEIAAEAPAGVEMAEVDGKPYESKKAPSRPGFNMQMTAQVVGTPEGWQLVTGLNQKGFGNKQEADTVAHNGQVQTADNMAGMVIVGGMFGGSDGEADTVAAENAVKAQRDENARATEPQEANRGVREASEPKTLAEIMAEKAERNADAVNEFQAADQERGHEAGFGMSR